MDTPCIRIAVSGLHDPVTRPTGCHVCSSLARNLSVCMCIGACFKMTLRQHLVC